MGWDGIGIICCGMGWDGTEKYVPWTSLEIGHVLIFSSVKISTYRYYKTNKTLSFVYHCLHAHRISPPQKEFLIIEMKLRYCITLQKNTEKTILLYSIQLLLIVVEHISASIKA